jgi:hypothetical protein
MKLVRLLALLCVAAALFAACAAPVSTTPPTAVPSAMDENSAEEPEVVATEAATSESDATEAETVATPDAATLAFEEGVTLAVLPDTEMLTRNPFDNKILENKPCDRLYTSDMSLTDGRVNIEAQYTAAGYTFEAATETSPGTFSYTFNSELDETTGKNKNVVVAIVAKAPDTITERQMGTDKLLVVLSCFKP